MTAELSSAKKNFKEDDDTLLMYSTRILLKKDGITCLYSKAFLLTFKITSSNAEVERRCPATLITSSSRAKM